MELAPGHVIGNYRVIRRIGSGGMGSVYEVESVDLHERYALKTFTYDPKDDDGDVLKNKFLEEGKILARLRHPNIAHVYTLAYDRELGLLYFVMDLILSEAGSPYSLENAIGSELDEDTVLKWFADICEALDYIHSQGIVHRDIKPGNLLIKRDGHVVLTDFGIAKINSGKIKEEVNPAMTMRIDGNITVLGSNHYIAPEVDSGGEVTLAADAYSLGVMMYELLTGRFYDTVENPWSLLEGSKYAWKRVLSRFLAKDPSARPLGYAVIAKRMPNWQEEPEAEDTGKSKEILKGMLLPACVASVLVVFIGIIAVAHFMRQGKPPVESVYIPPPISAREDESFLKSVEREIAENEEAADETATETPTGEEESVERESEKPAKETEEIGKREEPSHPGPVEAAAEKVQQISEPATAAGPASTPVAAPPKPEPKKIDYGPIPNKTYGWFDVAKGNAPREVVFDLANGEKIFLQPYAVRRDYRMLDGWDMGTRAHMVNFTRPYWISKFCIEPSVLREWNAKGFEDCREIERAVGGKYKVYRNIGYRDIVRFCAFLTDKYRSQLPPGYVFRLPTEAEWDRAIDRQGFIAACEREKLPSWTELTNYGGAKLRADFVAIRRSFNLDRFGTWETAAYTSGYLVGKGILIGGRSRPSPNGVYDVAYGTQPLLDFLPAGSRLVYAESELDPVQGADGIDPCDQSKAWILCRRWDQTRANMHAGCAFVFHLALGPDLMGEQAWNKRIVSENLATAKTPAVRYDWNPKRIPSKVSRPKEIDLRLVNGAKMTFCAIPKGKFTMSNVPGQESKSHKVELTYPFWMSKYCVTTEQRREYGKYDCEGLCRGVEKAFPDSPVYCAFNRIEWDQYCRFLTERYRDQLPEGYVFRLPTEAEYEWAFVADEKNEVGKVSAKINPGDKKSRESFAKRLKKNHQQLIRDMDGRGFMINGNVCLGGVAEPNVWGVHDIWLDGWSQWTYDLYDFDAMGKGNGSPEQNILYEEREKNPFHWDGKFSHGGIVRSGRSGRQLLGYSYEARAHIVLAPDFLTPLRESEKDLCPESDFGGKLVEGAVVHSLSSEQNPQRWCTPERKAKLLSREPSVAGEEGKAFLTQAEAEPWVQIELAQRTTLAGAVVEASSARGHSAHLVFWISEDGKRWRECGRMSRTLGRYRFEFKGKNANRVKYVRIGREPGYSEEAFSLNKVWLYGKR